MFIEVDLMVIAEELYFFNNLNVIENREPIKIFSLLKLILFLKNTGVLWPSCQIFLSNICYSMKKTVLLKEKKS